MTTSSVAVGGGRWEVVLVLDQLPILEWSAEEGPGLDLALQTVGRRVLPVLVGLPGDGPHPVPAQHSTTLPLPGLDYLTCLPVLPGSSPETSGLSARSSRLSSLSSSQTPHSWELEEWRVA